MEPPPTLDDLTPRIIDVVVDLRPHCRTKHCQQGLKEASLISVNDRLQLSIIAGQPEDGGDLLVDVAICSTVQPSPIPYPGEKRRGEKFALKPEDLTEVIETLWSLGESRDVVRSITIISNNGHQELLNPDSSAVSKEDWLKDWLTD